MSKSWGTMLSHRSSEKKWLIVSGIYSILLLLTAGVVNFIVPHSHDPSGAMAWQAYILWAALYLPVLILPVFSGWKMQELGFSFGAQVAVVSVIIMGICSLIVFSNQLPWRVAAREAFARTGEEVFFRGFLYYYIARLFIKTKRPWLWAILITSFLFTMVHTQAFQPGSLSSSGYPADTTLYSIEELGNIFLIGVVVGAMRAWTHSILPAAIIHCLLNGGVFTLPFVLVIYSCFLFLNRLLAKPVPWTGKPEPTESD